MIDLQTLINLVIAFSLFGGYFWLRGLDKRYQLLQHATTVAFGAVDAHFDKLTNDAD